MQGKGIGMQKHSLRHDFFPILIIEYGFRKWSTAPEKWMKMNQKFPQSMYNTYMES